MNPSSPSNQASLSKELPGESSAGLVSNQALLQEVAPGLALSSQEVPVQNLSNQSSPVHASASSAVSPVSHSIIPEGLTYSSADAEYQTPVQLSLLRAIEAGNAEKAIQHIVNIQQLADKKGYNLLQNTLGDTQVLINRNGALDSALGKHPKAQTDDLEQLNLIRDEYRLKESEDDVNWLVVCLKKALERDVQIENDQQKKDWFNLVLQPLVAWLKDKNLSADFYRAKDDTKISFINYLARSNPEEFALFLLSLRACYGTLPPGPEKLASLLLNALKLSDKANGKHVFIDMMKYQSIENITMFLILLDLTHNQKNAKEFKHMDFSSKFNKETPNDELDLLLHKTAACIIHLVNVDRNDRALMGHDARIEALTDKVPSAYHHILSRYILRAQLHNGFVAPTKWTQSLQKFIDKCIPVKDDDSTRSWLEVEYASYKSATETKERPQIQASDWGEKLMDIFSPEFRAALLEYGAMDFAHCQYLWDQITAAGPNPSVAVIKLEVILRELAQASLLFRGVRDEFESCEKYLAEAYPVIMQDGNDAVIPEHSLARAEKDRGVLLNYLAPKIVSRYENVYESLIRDGDKALSPRLQWIWGGTSVKVGDKEARVTSHAGAFWKQVSALEALNSAGAVRLLNWIRFSADDATNAAKPGLRSADVRKFYYAAQAVSDGYDPKDVRLPQGKAFENGATTPAAFLAGEAKLDATPSSASTPTSGFRSAI